MDCGLINSMLQFASAVPKSPIRYEIGKQLEVVLRTEKKPQQQIIGHISLNSLWSKTQTDVGTLGLNAQYWLHYCLEIPQYKSYFLSEPAARGNLDCLPRIIWERLRENR